ncbi:phosphatidate phosphatase LPIN1-like isoform X1 [Gymnodraco acuticeps]|uniref:phosphatidate phosphatase n=1 Tax=Gymnodraco acuticeps TaxID=8218 RepID=A0A6P8VCT9_GYMAC|nr:phosphatidate phosphatase LPIN1-like isoform X1 [Gymnodraco acuticeps]XP_034088074.1 phosphatidate phosphatase LPIN1-like isoform X1 [Gymnodraco acuticeps]
MNYVGQLAGQVFVQVKELYRGLNPATLSGCIDVIVVRQPDGTLKCSPFHVRFGKMGVLRSSEKLVDIEINGEPVSLHMKLGENGEAFFVKETENTMEIVPSYLATSPIVSTGAELMESQLGRGTFRHHDTIPCGSLPVQSLGMLQSDGGMIKKRRKRRKKARPEAGGGGGRREESDEEFSEDQDMFTIDLSSDEEREGDGRPVYGDQGSIANTLTHPSTDWIRSQSHGIKTVETLSIPSACGLSISCPQETSHFPPHVSGLDDSRSSTPKSDSELTNQKNPEILWTWGELPQAAQPAFLTDHQKQHPPPVVSIPVSSSTHFRTILDTGPPSLILYAPQPGESAAHSEDKDTEESKSGVRAELTMATVDRPGVGEVENVGQSCAEIEGLSAGSVSPRILIDHLEEGGAGESPIRSTDSPSKRKEKRSQHLGADGIYLDDITELQPEVAALYFPKSDGGSSSMRGDSELMMMGVRSANQSPHSEGSSGMGSSGMDSGVDSLSDHIGDLPHVSISLCGGLTDNREITRDQFQERAISYKQFSENPSLIDDPNLVVKIGNKYYNWNTAAPVMLAMQVYQKPLPQCWCLSYVFSAFGLFSYCLPGLFGSSPSQPASVENIMKEKMPKKGGRWWFSWRSRNSDSKSESVTDGGGDSGESSLTMPSMNSTKDESSSSDEDNRSSNQASGSCQPEPLMSPGSVFYKKTLRLNSEQLASLQLKEGANEVVFSVTTQYQGTCRCHGTIYLWSWDDKIVISDIDGTITRSDTLGHILPTLGKDWTHQGIARFYHKVSQNGYKFMFCSARAIGMADMTRGYLHWVNERGTMLPMGPVLLSPSSLFSALHREVIEKKPEKFKIECLSDIKQLFYPNTEPFYAAFGNRATDVYSYKEVGVPLNRIFTVNPKGELIQEHAKTNISSYVRLCEMVDHDFPLLAPNEGADLLRSDTFDQCYWNKELPEGTDEQGEEPQPLEAS